MPVRVREHLGDQAVDPHPHRRPGVLDGLAHQPVPCRVGDSQVEDVVGGAEPQRLAVGAHDLVGVPQDGQVLVGAPVGGQPGRGALDRDAVVERLLDFGKLLGQQGTDPFLVLGLVEHENATACPAPADDVPLAFQDADGLADGGAGHAKLLSQRPLRRQLVTGKIGADVDGSPYPFGDDLVGGGEVDGFDAGQSARHTRFRLPTPRPRSRDDVSFYEAPYRDAAGTPGVRD